MVKYDEYLMSQLSEEKRKALTDVYCYSEFLAHRLSSGKIHKWQVGITFKITTAVPSQNEIPKKSQIFKLYHFYTLTL